MAEMDLNTSKRTLKKFKFILCTLLVSLGYLWSGILVGRSSFWFNQPSFSMSPGMYFLFQQSGTLVSFMAFAAAISVLLFYQTLNRVNPKIYIVLVLFLVLVFLTIFEMGVSFFGNILIERLLGGFLIGVFHYLMPIYLGDLAGDGNNGDNSDSVIKKEIVNFILFTQFAVGILAGYIEDYAASFYVNIAYFVIPLILLIGLIFLPSSPRYDTVKNNFKKAENTLLSYRISKEAIKNDIDFWKDKIDFLKLKKGLKTPSRPIYGLVLCEQMIGVTALMFYLMHILIYPEGSYQPQCKVFSVMAAFILSLGIRKISSGLISPKVMLLVTTILMMILLFLVGTYCHYVGSNQIPSDYEIYALFGIATVFFLYGLGFYEINKIYLDILIPRNKQLVVRTIAETLKWTLIGVLTWLFPLLWTLLGTGWIFYLMGIACVFSIIFVHFNIPNMESVKNKKIFDNGTAELSEEAV